MTDWITVAESVIGTGGASGVIGCIMWANREFKDIREQLGRCKEQGESDRKQITALTTIIVADVEERIAVNPTDPKLGIWRTILRTAYPLDAETPPTMKALLHLLEFGKP